MRRDRIHRSRSPTRRRSYSPSDNRRGRDSSPSDRHGHRAAAAVASLPPKDSYKEFMAHQDDQSDPEVYAKRYDEYKLKYERRLQTAFFEDHKRELWLQQRYSPAIAHRFGVQKNARSRASASELLTSLPAFAFDESGEDAFQLTSSITPQDNCIVSIRRVPCSCPYDALHQHLVSSGAGGFKALYLSDPAKKAALDFDRVGWIVYHSPEAASEALVTLHGTFLHDSEMQSPVRLQVSVYRARAPIVLSAFMNTSERLRHDLDQSLAWATQLDMRAFGDTAFVTALTTATAQLSIKRQLDALIGYLRHVHYVVYYAGVACLDMGDLLHTHAAPLVRAAASVETGEAQLEKGRVLAEKLDADIALAMTTAAEGVAAAARDTELVQRVEAQEEELLAEVYDKYVDAVDEGEKQRCSLCTKLFKAPQFVKKHLRNKHPEVVLEKISAAGEKFMWDAYIADADRPIPPETTNAASQGGSSSGGGRRGGRDQYHAAGAGDRGYHHRSRGEYQPRSGGRGGRPERSDRYSGGRGGSGGRRGSGGGGYNSYNNNSYNDQNRGPPPPREEEMTKDPRQVTSYRDLDNLKDNKVELDFSSAIGSLPPPKKKSKLI